MPIKPENRKRYPANWPSIRHAILERARHRCEWCDLPNYAVGRRDPDGVFIPICGNGPLDMIGAGLLWPSCALATYADAAEVVSHLNDHGNAYGPRYDYDGHHWFAIVLTIAHVTDPAPENVDPSNLAALCQRCHNRHDSEHRVRRRRANRRGETRCDLQPLMF